MKPKNDYSLKYCKVYECLKIPDRYKQEFRNENAKINITRIKSILLVLITMSTLVGIYLSFYKMRYYTLPTPNAITMHVVMVVFCCIFWVVTSFITKDENCVIRYASWINIVFIIYIIAWSMLFSLNSQITNGQITVYILGIIFLSILLYTEPYILAICYFLMNCVFTIILPYFHTKGSLLVSHRINSFCLITVAWFIEVLLYKNRLHDHIQRKIIEEQNKELANLNSVLERLSSIDELTGIYNRGFFNRMISVNWSHSVREHIVLSGAMIDIDFFKSYNDHYGHLAGDECLKNVVNAVSSIIRRPMDLIARFGGEEFIVLLPNTDTNGAYHLCESMRKAVEELSIPNLNSTFGYVTISIGVCTVHPEYDCNYLDFLDNVDKALYQAKKSGRNRVVSHEIAWDSEVTG